jgi:hypothetical protein
MFIHGEGDRIMEDVQIKLSALWVALMLTYLLGDVLRIFSGDFKSGEIGGIRISQTTYLGIAILKVIPIVMVFLSLTLNYPANRWANIIVAILFFGFNLIGLPTYPSAYDKFLIIVGLAFNVLTVWYAWKVGLNRKNPVLAMGGPPAWWISSARGTRVERGTESRSRPTSRT